MFSGMELSFEICVVTVLLLGVKNPLHSGIKRSENAINSQGYTICRRRCARSGRNRQLRGLSSVLRKTKEEGDQKSTMDVRRYDIYFTIPQSGTSQGVVYSGREVKLMNSILRLNPLALWEGAGS